MKVHFFPMHLTQSHTFGSLMIVSVCWLLVSAQAEGTDGAPAATLGLVLDCSCGGGAG